MHEKGADKFQTAVYGDLRELWALVKAGGLKLPELTPAEQATFNAEYNRLVLSLLAPYHVLHVVFRLVASFILLHFFC